MAQHEGFLKIRESNSDDPTRPLAGAWGDPSREIPQNGTIRKFETGATRDTDNGKPDYSGFLSPLALKRFGQYMHQHRKQSDGTLRASDNWKKGIPKDAYLQSLLRHVMDVWLIQDGFRDEATTQDLTDALCGVLFNTQGMLHEVLKGQK